MVIQLLPDAHRDFGVFERGKLAPRAYFIPFGSSEKAGVDFRRERYSSDLVKVLSGEWDFKYYPDSTELPLYLDTASVPFEKIKVPSTWQRAGVEKPIYLNTRYEFVLVPPEVPFHQSCALYRKNVCFDEIRGRKILSFLGVSGGLEVFVNGSFAGYSEGAHNTAEFDITPLLRQGVNEICAMVHKFSTGSYLECQDMFREQGIFRDVLLYELPETGIYDFAFETSKRSAGVYKASLGLDIYGTRPGVKVRAELKDAEGSVVAAAEAGAAEKVSLDLSASGVTEWNAEEPYLYTLSIALSDENGEFYAVRKFVGFKTVEIDGSVYLFNGKKIKFKGVNHHDTHIDTGYVMTPEDLERDVRLMKSLNVNAVRTSHYPPDPLFLILADVYGLYIVDEADIETHGMYELGGTVDFISEKPEWEERYVDRVKRMYARDKNSPCVAMWSLGNESGGYRNQDKCCEYLHSVSSIPVHYEGVIGTERFHYDVISEMYTSLEELAKLRDLTRLRGGRIDDDYFAHPFFLCEYCHAMGVGPGNLEDYWKLFYSDDRFMGGCIWEWADHTVKYGDGEHMFTYGGDHGEKRHDGHFCVDGLIFADRRLHTGAREMKIVYRPLRSELSGGSDLRITNTNRFRSSGYISIKWVMRENGRRIAAGEIAADIAPLATEVFHIELPEAQDASVLSALDVYYYADGSEIAYEQHILRNESLSLTAPENRVDVSELKKSYIARFDGGEMEFSKGLCSPVRLVYSGREVFNLSPAEHKGVAPNLFRALIDNDSRPRGAWLDAGLDRLACVPVSLKYTGLADRCVFECKSELTADGEALYNAFAVYTVFSDGRVDVESRVQPCSDKAVLDVPRSGVTFELSPEFGFARYLGRGPYENMPDFIAQSPIGLYTAAISDMTEPYVYPQDSGNHGDAKFVSLSTADGFTVTLAARDSFSFSLRRTCQTTLNNASHIEDAADENTTYVSIDGYVRGIGSSSCGPDTTAEFIRPLGENEHVTAFSIIPGELSI
ncbi:MAG: hypothetical protein K6C36_06510 [Clostridia bacterium]|nr:hypothetical protein [Clostridia bacterium]